jgi:hypothetical protein
VKETRDAEDCRSKVEPASAPAGNEMILGDRTRALDKEVKVSEKSDGAEYAGDEFTITSEERKEIRATDEIVDIVAMS